MGVAPRPLLKALMSNAPFTLSRSCGELTHNHAPAAPWLAQGAFGVAHRQPGAGGSLWTTALPREGGSVWQIFTQEHEN